MRGHIFLVPQDNNYVSDLYKDSMRQFFGRFFSKNNEILNTILKYVTNREVSTLQYTRIY